MEPITSVTGSRRPLPQDAGAILGAYAPRLQPPVDTASSPPTVEQTSTAERLLPLFVGAAPGASIGSIAGRALVGVRNRFPNSPPTPRAIPGRDPVLLPKGPVNARGRQQTSSLEEAKSVFSDVFDTQQSAVGKLFREDIGDITVDYGRMGIPERRFRTGFGLAKIEAKRTSQGMDGEDFVRNVLPRVLTQGVPYRLSGKKFNRRAEIRLGDDLAIFSLFRRNVRNGTRKDARETWLLTGYRKLPEYEN